MYMFRNICMLISYLVIIVQALSNLDSDDCMWGYYYFDPTKKYKIIYVYTQINTLCT